MKQLLSFALVLALGVLLAWGWHPWSRADQAHGQAHGQGHGQGHAQQPDQAPDPEPRGDGAAADRSEDALVLATLGQRAEELHDRGDHDASARAYDQASRAAADAGDDELALAYRAQSGVCLKKAGRHAEALAVMAPALAEARANGWRRTEGLALGNLARLHDLLGDLAEGLAFRDQLVDFALEEGDTRLAVWTLEQSATAALDLGDVDGADARARRALELDPEVMEGDRRHDALVRLRAAVAVLRGDDVGAAVLWESVPPSPASLANRANHLALLGLHADAADMALDAAGLYAEAGDAAGSERALVVHISELIAARLFAPADAKVLAIKQQEASAEALAPFLLVSAQVNLAEGRVDAALQDLVAIRSAGEPSVEAEQFAVLAHAMGGNRAEALEVAQRLPPGRARGLLMAWTLSEHASSAGLGLDQLEDLVDVPYVADPSAAHLRRYAPVPLPSLAHALVATTLGDVGRLREGGLEDLAATYLHDGLVQALTWHAVEAIEAVPGLSPAAALGEAGRARVLDLVEGRLPDGHALALLLPGTPASYLVLCVAGRPATTFGLRPATALHDGVAEALGRLQDPDPASFAQASFAYHESIFPELAQDDLKRVEHLTLVLPEELAALPPAILATDAPEPGQPVPWLIYEHTLSLLPHVLAGVGIRSAGAGAGAGADADADAERLGATRVGDAEPALTSIPLAGPRLTELFGAAVTRSMRMRSTAVGGTTLRGADSNAVALRAAAERTGWLELAVPSAGSGRLGGLLLSPAPDAAHEDERRGFVPWHRLATWDLPPLVITDRSLFHPDEVSASVGFAATALMQPAEQVLLTRWPSPIVPEIMFQRIIERLESGEPLGAAVSGAQRDYLIAAGDHAQAWHPRLWGCWLPFAAR